MRNQNQGIGNRFVAGARARDLLHDKDGDIDDKKPAANQCRHGERIEIASPFLAVIIAIVDAHDCPSPHRVLFRFYHTDGVGGKTLEKKTARVGFRALNINPSCLRLAFGKSLANAKRKQTLST